MKTQLFQSKTTSSNKVEILTSLELDGLKKYGSNKILTHENVIYKGLNSFWVNAKQLANLKLNNQVILADF